MREVLLLCWRDSAHPQGGGSEAYLHQVGSRLAAAGIKVTLRTARYPGAARREVVDGVVISRAGGRFTVYPRALLALAGARIGVGPLRGVRPDAVVDTQNGIPFFARTVVDAPVTVLVHHCHREQWPVAGRLLGRFGWWLESVVSPRAHRHAQYLTVSLPSAEDLVALGVDRDRIAVVRNGISPIPDRPLSARAAEPRLVVLSRLVPHKQIEDALEALARLRDAHPGLTLDVVGDGWWAPQLRRRARELGVVEAVRFHGHVSEADKHDLLAQAWVHVLPSRTEGWALAVIEAAQHGVPTVGYRSSRGLTDSIVDGATGVLVDDVAELADAVGELLSDPQARTDLGVKARQRAGEFSWDETARGVVHVLRATVAGRTVAGLVAESA